MCSLQGHGAASIIHSIHQVIFGFLNYLSLLVVLAFCFHRLVSIGNFLGHLADRKLTDKHFTKEHFANKTYLEENFCRQVFCQQRLNIVERW